MTRARTALLAAAGLWALTRLVNRRLVVVRGPSMLPDLREGEQLLTLPRTLLPLRVGQVVVVEDPAEPGHLVVKRLAGLDDAGALVLGDNPAASTDGRVWGPLPPRAVRRVAIARWPSLSRQGLTDRGHAPGPGP